MVVLKSLLTLLIFQIILLHLFIMENDPKLHICVWQKYVGSNLLPPVSFNHLNHYIKIPIEFAGTFKKLYPINDGKPSLPRGSKVGLNCFDTATMFYTWSKNSYAGIQCLSFAKHNAFYLSQKVLFWFHPSIAFLVFHKL